MPTSESTATAPFRLPNGLNAYGLNENDTLVVYRDIFEDDCYRRHGVTIRDGDCVLDVGANTGLFILFLNSIKADVRVFAFEPVPAIFRVLRRNVEAYSRLDVTLSNVGLGRERGRASCTYYPRFSNASTFYPDDSERTAELARDYVLSRVGELPRPLPYFVSLFPAWLRRAVAERVRKYYLKQETVTCELRTLADVLREHRIGRVDLLKIDAEQSEGHILEGLPGEDWPKVRQVIVEVHQGEEATRQIVGLLEGRGFTTAVDPNPALPGLSLVYGVRESRGVSSSTGAHRLLPP